MEKYLDLVNLVYRELRCSSAKPHKCHVIYDLLAVAAIFFGYLLL